MNKKNSKTLFVVLEGPDGSGKTTLMNLVQKKLLKNPDYDVLCTEEPTKSHPFINLRDPLLKSKKEINPLEEALMFILDRHRHLKTLDKWANNNNKKVKIILCDRYFYSTFVYQGHFGKLSFEEIECLHKTTKAWKIPDLVFFLSLKNNILTERFIAKNQKFDRFHRKDNSTVLCLQKVYLELALHFLKHKNPHPIKVIKVGEDVERDSNIIYQGILKKLTADGF